MASRMKELERQSKSYEDRWNRSMRDNNAGETYSASCDFAKNIEEQKKELKNIDPNSREYEKAETSIAQQESKLWDMKYAQSRQFSDQKVAREVENLQTKNEDISRKMSQAAEKGDTRTYDSLRSQYDKNIAMQEQMGKRLKEDGIDYKDTLQQQRIDKQNLDIDMRNKVAEKVAKQTEKGKPVKQEDREALDKYSTHVKHDEIENVKKQNQQKIDGMRARGASEQEIAYQKEQNERDEKWVESINR